MVSMKRVFRADSSVGQKSARRRRPPVKADFRCTTRECRPWSRGAGLSGWFQRALTVASEQAVAATMPFSGRACVASPELVERHRNYKALSSIRDLPAPVVLPSRRAEAKLSTRVRRFPEKPFGTSQTPTGRCGIRAHQRNGVTGYPARLVEPPARGMGQRTQGRPQG